MQRMLIGLLVTICACLTNTFALAQKPSLKGSKESVARMELQAEIHDYDHLSTGRRVITFFRGGLLVQLKGNKNYRLDDEVSYPYVRREIRLFVERWSSQSRSTCEDVLTITSSTRPTNAQPSNASKRSVHPTGMAIDFRIPREKACRVWVESTLLFLEGKRVLEATRETSPPHYHVAVFPNPYKEYVDSLKKKAAAAVKKKPPVKRKK